MTRNKTIVSLIRKLCPESPARMRRRIYKTMRQDNHREITGNWKFQAEAKL